MSDIREWDSNAVNNQQPVPDGFPEGQQAGTLNDCSREVMAASKRLWDDTQGAQRSSSGGANSYVLTPSQIGITSYTDGLSFSWVAHAANEGPVLLSADGGSTFNAVLKHRDIELDAGDIKQDQLVTVFWVSEANAWQMTSQLGNDMASASDVYGILAAFDVI